MNAKKDRKHLAAEIRKLKKILNAVAVSKQIPDPGTLHTKVGEVITTG